jgi:Ca2+:H+ antiporter
MHPMEFPVSSGHNRMSIYHRLVPGGLANTGGAQRRSQSLHRKLSSVSNLESDAPSRSQTPLPRNADHSHPGLSNTTFQKTATQPASPPFARRVSYVTSSAPHHVSIPVSESVDQAVKDASVSNMPLPDTMTTDDFTRAVAVATVSALRHQEAYNQSPARIRASGATITAESEGGAHNGHDAPSWSRTTSASVLLACTALFALIAGTFALFHTIICDNRTLCRNFG